MIVEWRDCKSVDSQSRKEKKIGRGKFVPRCATARSEVAGSARLSERAEVLKPSRVGNHDLKRPELGTPKLHGREKVHLSHSRGTTDYRGAEPTL